MADTPIVAKLRYDNVFSLGDNSYQLITSPLNPSRDDNTPPVKPNYRVVLEKDEDGRTVAKCKDIRGVITDGATEQEALANIGEAITAYLESEGKTKEFNLMI